MKFIFVVIPLGILYGEVKMFPPFLRSLILSTIVSFFAPVILLGGVLCSVWLLAITPGFHFLGQPAIDLICQFLAIFGDGSWLHGMLVIAIVCSFVGAMFDTYAFHNFQTQKN